MLTLDDLRRRYPYPDPHTWELVLGRILARLKLGPVPTTRPDLGPCWLWTGVLSAGGRYAIARIEDRYYYVHRTLFTHFVGPIPEGLELDHLCRFTRCCNPYHLEAVTKQVNMSRRVYVKGLIAVNRGVPHTAAARAKMRQAWIHRRSKVR